MPAMCVACVVVLIGICHATQHLLFNEGVHMLLWLNVSGPLRVEPRASYAQALATAEAKVEKLEGKLDGKRKDVQNLEDRVSCRCGGGDFGQHMPKVQGASDPCINRQGLLLHIVMCAEKVGPQPALRDSSHGVLPRSRHGMWEHAATKCEKQ